MVVCNATAQDTHCQGKGSTVSNLRLPMKVLCLWLLLHHYTSSLDAQVLARLTSSHSWQPQKGVRPGSKASHSVWLDSLHQVFWKIHTTQLRFSGASKYLSHIQAHFYLPKLLCRAPNTNERPLLTCLKCIAVTLALKYGLLVT